MRFFHVFVNPLRHFVTCMVIFAGLSNAMAQLSCGQTIDLNTWTQEGMVASGNWGVAPGGNSLQQTINGQPTWFVSPNDFIDVLIQGSIQVNTSADDDMVGFVFGYQNPVGVMANPASTYTKSFFFDWKQGTQVYQGMTSNEGFALYEVDGLYNYNAPFYNEFWQRVTTPFMTVIDTDYGNNGWNDFQQYQFQLKYTTDSIVIWINGTRIFEEGGCFEPGKFGFYNFSQSFVNYSDFSYNIEYDFSASDTLICLGDTSFFEIGVGCNNVLPTNINYSWNFGDGTSSSGINPFHVYSAPGVYQAELISVDPFGCSDTSIQIVEVLGYPVPDAGLDDISCTLDYDLSAGPTQGQWTALSGGVFSDPSLPNSTVTVPFAGTYEFEWEATNAAGCSTFDTVSIEFIQLTLTATTTDPSCNGGINGEIVITPSGGALPMNYQWNAAAGNQTTNPAINLGDGTYNVVVTDNYGCFIDTNFTLSDPLPLSFTLDLLPSDCDFADGSATFSGVSGGSAPYSYDWGTGLIPDNFALGLTSGTYSVTISDNLGCDSLVTYTITNTPFIIDANVVNDISCFGFNDGEAIALGPNMLAAYTYQWGASSNNQTTQNATNLIPGNHDVTIISSGGCSETTTVTIIEPPVLSVSATDLSICTGDLAALSATADGGIQPYTLTWENAAGQAQNPIDVLVTQTEVFTVTAVDANGCTTTDDMTLTALVAPVASFVVDLNEACLRPSYSFNFENTSTPAGSSVVWDFGDLNSATGDFASHSYVSPGTYSVSLDVTSPNGCTDSHTETDFIVINPSPTAEFTYSPSEVTNLNSIVQFVDLSYNDIASWDWTISDFTTSSSQNTMYDFESNLGNHIVFLTVENIYGCLDSTSRIVEVVNEITVYAPNTFTPDDDEFNQTWRVHLGGLDLFSVEINIYNRWGEKVWQSFDVDVPWDGTYNGKVVQDGVYTWTLSAGDLNTDKKYEWSGNVNVLR